MPSSHRPTATCARSSASSWPIDPHRHRPKAAGLGPGTGSAERGDAGWAARMASASGQPSRMRTVSERACRTSRPGACQSRQSSLLGWARAASTARQRYSTTDNPSTDPGPQLRVARKRHTASKPITVTVNHQVKPHASGIGEATELAARSGTAAHPPARAPNRRRSVAQGQRHAVG
jgi:hypothetical protein